MKRIAKWGALILCSLFIITIFGCRDDDDSDNHLTGYEYTDEDINPLSDIEKLPRMTANNTLDIRFIVMGDPHVEADLHQCFSDNCDDYWKINSHYVCQRNVSARVNSRKDYFDQVDHSPPLIGVINVGDMIFGDQPNHSIWLYRTLWENTASFSDSDFNNLWFNLNDGGYSGGDWDYWRTSLPVFPCLGNHDDPSEDSMREKVRQYVKDRVQGSDALYHPWGPDAIDGDNWYDHPPSDIYIWEWGSFHFISMGLWSFYAECDNCGENSESRSRVLWDKVAWLQNHLETVGKEKAIILIQHFGWDGQSLGEKNKNGDPLWWDDRDADLLTDLICDRSVEEGNNGACDDPYNVIAIFSGHEHLFDYRDVCLDDDCSKTVPNYIVDDAGMCNSGDNNYNGGTAGFFIVHLNATEGRMEVSKDILSDEWRDNETEIDPWKTVDIKTAFLRFDQGEPDDQKSDCYGNCNCAVMKANGRYETDDCYNLYPAVCYDPNQNQWQIKPNSLQIWSYCFEDAADLGLEFREPKTVEDQAEIIRIMKENDLPRAWVNYSDRVDDTGNWKELVVDFNAVPQNGGPPLTVSFFDDSQATVEAYLWNFGDGTSSSEKNPVHTYEDYGTYTVELEVTVKAIGSNPSIKKTKVGYIMVGPHADFVYDGICPMECGGTCNKTFTNQSVGNSLTYLWDFGDGQTSTLENPEHSFAAPRNGTTYAVKLEITDSKGVSDSMIKTIEITCVDPFIP